MAGWKTSKDLDQKQRRILVTGGAGFIGSNFVRFFLRQRPGNKIVNLDKLTYAGNRDNLRDIEASHNYVFCEGDVCDSKLIDEIFKTHQITDVIHFAAESHVDNAIAAPDPFIQTNILGTYELLKAAKHYWLDSTQDKNERNKYRFHHISTDEVYGSLNETGEAFTEQSPYTPNNPYSASKAGAAMLVRSYVHTYGLNAVITSCSNNYGPWQHQEKFIPTIIRKALALEPIPIYGDGEQVRDWLHVEDHCRALESVFDRGKTGETYNIGGRNEKINRFIAESICDFLDDMHPLPLDCGKKRYRELIQYVKDRPGHDRRYSINPEKIEGELGWRPAKPLSEGLRETVEWYVNQNVG